MCRNIVQLRRPDGAASAEEVRAAALQYVRKVSGYRQPSRRNAAAFDAAIEEIAAATERLLAALEPAGSNGRHPAGERVPAP